MPMNDMEKSAVMSILRQVIRDGYRSAFRVMEAAINGSSTEAALTERMKIVEQSTVEAIFNRLEPIWGPAGRVTVADLIKWMEPRGPSWVATIADIKEAVRQIAERDLLESKQ